MHVKSLYRNYFVLAYKSVQHPDDAAMRTYHGQVTIGRFGCTYCQKTWDRKLHRPEFGSERSFFTNVKSFENLAVEVVPVVNSHKFYVVLAYEDRRNIDTEGVNGVLLYCYHDGSRNVYDSDADAGL